MLGTPQVQQPSGPRTNTAAQNAQLSETSGLEVESALCVSRLRMVSEQIKQTSAYIEQSVVAVCGSFQDIAEKSNRNASRTAHFLGQHGSAAERGLSFEEILQTCERTIVTLLNVSLASGETALNAVRRIQKIDTTATEVHGFLRKLEHIDSGNKILALNAQIEAARSGAHGAGFNAVAVELASRTEDSRRVTVQVGDLIQELSSAANSTLTDLQKMQRDNSQRVEECRKEVHATLTALRSTNAQMQETLHVTQNEAAMLATDIGSAVRGLQFQDRVNQRLAHVVHDLEVVQSRMTPYIEGIEIEQLAEVNAFSHHVMHEERAIYGLDGDEAAEGDIELF